MSMHLRKPHWGVFGRARCSKGERFDLRRYACRDSSSLLNFPLVFRMPPRQVEVTSNCALTTKPNQKVNFVSSPAAAAMHIKRLFLSF
jgi:hypothetical protein